MALICDLLESSVTIQQQLIQNKGFLVISYLLEKVRIYLFYNRFPIRKCIDELPSRFVEEMLILMFVFQF